jgi:hypothetical protein
MPRNVEYQLNETQGKEYELPCQKCVGKTTHKALTTVDVHGRDGNHQYTFEWTDDHQIVQCLGCKSLSYRIESSNSEDEHQVGENEYAYTIRERLYPPRVEGRKGLGYSTVYLPHQIRQVYDETLIALSVQAPILAAIGLRALVEAVCHERQAQGNNLHQKIENLVHQQVLTPAGAKILHNIRTLGNAAAHEAKPHSERQLALAMDVVEHMLKDVYILPKQAESEFGDNPIVEF